MNPLPHRSPTYTAALELYLVMLKKGKHQVTYQEYADITGYSRLEGKDSFKLFQDITVLDQTIFVGLSTGAIKLIASMVEELKYNNALWYHEPANTRAYAPINELIEHGIIRRTETPHIYLVNPMKIRRGTVQGVLGQTVNLLKTVVKVNKDHIHDIRYAGSIEISAYDTMELGYGEKKMDSEPEA